LTETGAAKIEPPKRELPPFWVLSTYFAEGFPYSLVIQISTVFFKDFGASLQAVGLTSLFRLPWVLKFLWAPLADAYATKRFWLLLTEAALVAGAAVMALACSLPQALAVGGVVFLLLAFLSASQDIAVDGFYLEALDKRRQAKFVGYQAMAYRLALIAGGGGIVAFSGLTSWAAAYALAAVVLAALFAFHWFFLPRTETPRRPLRALAADLAAPRRIPWLALSAALAAAALWCWRSPTAAGLFAPARPLFERLGVPGVITGVLLLVLVGLALNLPRLKRRMEGSDSLYARAFVDWLDQPRVGVILAFLCTYRTGESFLQAMVYPMLKDIGVDRTHYGLVYGTFGIAASITGAILGGHLIGKHGLRRAIWPLVAAQNVPNLLYALLAFLYRDAAGKTGAAADIRVVALFVVMEAFGSGLGTAAFMVFIQRTCKASFKAAHFAVATSIMNISTTLAGVFSGFLAAWMGWTAFFVFTFAATLPSMLLVPFLPQLGRPDP
jgi:PAT family beta-lactamase induction signal transducer AmpG